MGFAAPDGDGSGHDPEETPDDRVRTRCTASLAGPRAGGFEAWPGEKEAFVKTAQTNSIVNVVAINTDKDIP